ncbi:MAG: RtcB family protein [Euryarchaeota archaeon]|nr:RtcB family protein [Euryarchaeota archaeon]
MDLLNLEKVTEYKWKLPQQESMRVPGVIYGNKQIIDHLKRDVELGKDWNALKQISNVACLPGIRKASIALSDVHPGYGFPIGGVAAFDTEDGVITMGGIGFDINCSVTNLKTSLKEEDIRKNARQLLNSLYNTVPAGLGSKGDIALNVSEIDEVLRGGAEWAIKQGYGREEDLEFIEENGRMEEAKPENVSTKAKKRQLKEMGTLGSGNHYVEVQYVDEIYDPRAAKVYGLEEKDVPVSFHCGSRALGHQIGTDYLKILAKATKKYNIEIRDRELVCAPIDSKEGQQYFSAVCCGMNCAFANHEILTHLIRKSFKEIFPEEELPKLYSIGHNTCKKEYHRLNGKKKLLYLHRKGATRAFGPGRKEIPKEYRKVGQPVLVGGTMGTCSYILRGTERGMNETFGSAIHGAGRAMSRNKAKRKYWGETVAKDLKSKGIHVKGHSMAGIAEEAPGAYKDIVNVVECVDEAGIAKKVAKVKPILNVKG